jgi:midasin
LKETGLHILLRGSFYSFQSPPRIELDVVDELDAVAFAQQQITNAQNLFIEYEQSFPQFRLIILPLRNWLASQILCIPRENQPSNQSDPGSDEVIEALLKSIQSILSAIPVEEQLPSPSQDNYLKDTSLALIRVGNLLRVDSKVTLLNYWVERLVGCPQEEIKQNVSRLLPFIQRYTLLVDGQLACMARWVNGLFKLQFAACSVMLNIATNGFCKPSDGEESGDESPEHENSAGGVGFGEGAGNENVSKEVEDESQVEGLKDEGGESNRKKNESGENDDDDAIEIGDDFQGDLEDIAENGSEEEPLTEEDEEDLEEKMANLDAGDPDSVDEKLWGDEAGPQDESKEGKRSEDQSDKPSADSEVAAKENERSKDNQLSKEKKSDDQNTVDESSNSEAKDEDMLGDEADEDNREAAVASGAALDDFVQDPETLDLPDGLEMNEDTAPQDVDDEVDDDMLGADGMTDSLNGDNEMQLENSPEPPSRRNDDIDNGATSDDQREEEETDTGLEDSYPEGDVNMQPDIRTSDETTNEPAPDHPSNANMREDTSESPSGGSRSAMATSTSEEGRGNDTSVHSLHWSSNMLSNLCISTVRDEKLERTAAENGNGSTANANASAEADATLPRENISHRVSHDHARSLGDAFKETIMCSAGILESDQAPAEHAIPNPETSRLQYLHEDDADHDMQALGPAGVEEVAKLSELRLVEDARGSNEADEMDVDDKEHPTPQLDFISPTLPPFPSDPLERALPNDTPGALPRSEVQSQQLLYGADMQNESHARNVEADDEVPKAEYVELTLRQWQADGQPSEGAQNLWRLYESLTQDLSYALCEQLRLILEPTLATRLKGDYRSGKRLNMKKIIPYIASEYTKDKIWLRRTRPSQREYQVFLVLDDSRSMAESHSIHLAYEALVLVSKALSRLEVGDIGIAKFGESVDVLYGFNQGPLTDQAATQVMTAFTFNQKATNVLALVETSLGILEAARETRTSAARDLWQLEIIISDGLCQDHQSLRAALRRAQEQRVMMVFIIVDSLHSNVAPTAHGWEGGGTGLSQTSILSMQQATYKSVDGRMELQMQRYLDTFPFDYYVVLRDVEALPEVLSGTIRQFFERISDV